MPERTDDLPLFADLPVDAEAPPQSSWGVWGRDDQLGTLNFQTPERRAAAARLVRRGAVFNLDQYLDLPAATVFGQRRPPTHVVLGVGGNARDEYLDSYFPQQSSQWDGLRHIRHPEHGFYNWTPDSSVDDPRGRLGVDNFARHGIVGRGVLIDLARHVPDLDPVERRALPAALLDDAAAAQGVAFQPGDVVMFRTGFDAWLKAHPGTPGAKLEGFACAGLEASEATAAWLWDRRVAAIASDCPGLEAWPLGEGGFLRSLHVRAIPLLGLVFGELLDLEALAADCAADGVYDCFFAAKPLMLRGGIGSSANALAVR